MFYFDPQKSLYLIFKALWSRFLDDLWKCVSPALFFIFCHQKRVFKIRKNFLGNAAMSENKRSEEAHVSRALRFIYLYMKEQLSREH